MKKQTGRALSSAVLVLGLLLPACRQKSAQQMEAKPSETASPSSVTLTPAAVKTAGIETAKAEMRLVAQTIHASGEIIFNLKRQAHVTARTAGRIEQISAYPGDRLQKGQLLLSLYSQEFLSLQADLFQAAERAKRIQAGTAEHNAAQSLLNSVRKRLRLFDVSDRELSEIESSGQMKLLLPVRSPLAGNAIEVSVKTGDYVELGASLFQIADLSKVWVDVHIFEKDLARVRPGCDVVIRAGAFPGREFRGSLFQIGSVVNEKARTLEGRVELDNPRGDLRPGMYVDADIASAAETRGLFVPGAAIQEFQNRQVVFVQTGGHTFVLRDVETGVAAGGFVEIRRGLKEQEAVATQGSFFIKSELMKNSLGGEQP